jgi:hypothetical protein
VHADEGKDPQQRGKEQWTAFDDGQNDDRQQYQCGDQAFNGGFL